MTASMELNVQSLIGGLILAGILWIAKSVSEQGKTLAILKTVLMGSEGSAGVDTEVRNISARQDTMGDKMNTLAGHHELLKQRVDVIELERRHFKRRSEDREEENGL